MFFITLIFVCFHCILDYNCIVQRGEYVPISDGAKQTRHQRSDMAVNYRLESIGRELSNRPFSKRSSGPGGDCASRAHTVFFHNKPLSKRRQLSH